MKRINVLFLLTIVFLCFSCASKEKASLREDANNNISYENEHIRLGSPNGTPLHLAAAYAIRQDANSRAKLVDAKITQMNAVYSKNPACSNEAFKVLLKNNSKIDLMAATSVNGVFKNVSKYGKTDLKVKSRVFTLYLRHLDGEEYTEKEYTIPNPTPKINIDNRIYSLIIDTNKEYSVYVFNNERKILQASISGDPSTHILSYGMGALFKTKERRFNLHLLNMKTKKFSDTKFSIQHPNKKISTEKGVVSMRIDITRSKR